VNRKELVESIQKNKDLTDLSKKAIDTVLSTALDSIKKAVKKGDDVSLIGFGTFTKQKRKARTGVNPATGEKIKIKAKNVVKFKAGKAFKEML
jgi:DNA-binding protein HU-beta